MIMVSSTSGLLGNVGQANYGSAKFGIVALARIVAMENQSRGITANVIAPSADTRMTRSVPTPKDPEAAAAREENERLSARLDALEGGKPAKGKGKAGSKSYPAADAAASAAP